MTSIFRKTAVLVSHSVGVSESSSNCLQLTNGEHHHKLWNENKETVSNAKLASTQWDNSAKTFPSNLQSQCFRLRWCPAPSGSLPALLSSASPLAASWPPPSFHPGWSFHLRRGQTAGQAWEKWVNLTVRLNGRKRLRNRPTCTKADWSSFSPNMWAVSPIILGPISSTKSSKSIKPPTVVRKEEYIEINSCVKNLWVTQNVLLLILICCTISSSSISVGM